MATHHTAESLSVLISSNVSHRRVDISVVVIPSPHTLKLHLYSIQTLTYTTTDTQTDRKTDGVYLVKIFAHM